MLLLRLYAPVHLCMGEWIFKERFWFETSEPSYWSTESRVFRNPVSAKR